MYGSQISRMMDTSDAKRGMLSLPDGMSCVKHPFPRRCLLGRKAGLLTRTSCIPQRLPASPCGETVAHCCVTPCLQWRDRAGFAPASLFTLPAWAENLTAYDMKLAFWINDRYVQYSPKGATCKTVFEKKA